MPRNEQTLRRGAVLRACLLVGILTCVLLSACGQKGDLYLPADAPPARQ